MAVRTLPEQDLRPTRKVPQRARGTGLTVLTWVVTIIFVFPVLWLVLTAFKHEQDAYTDPPSLFFTPTFEQFANVFELSFLPYLANSSFVTALSTIAVLLLGIPAAYALSLVPVKNTPNALGFFLGTKMLPVVAAIIPLYIISQNLNLLDNVWMLIILYTAMNLPLAIWMMRSFFLEVPTEMIEAGRVDG
ncbi:MAG: carbohydrate ABC transporter permease, partial [Haloechinothrix sp.]